VEIFYNFLLVAPIRARYLSCISLQDTHQNPEVVIECAEILFHTRKILCSNMAQRIVNLIYVYE